MSTHPQAPNKPTQAEAAAKAAAASAAADAAASSAVQVLPHNEKVAQALVRMQASRASLRGALLPTPSRGSAAGGSQRSAGGAGSKFGNVGRLLWRQLRGQWRESPSLQVAVQTLQGWWRKQPWHSAVSLVGGELHGAVAPMVRRNPWSAVAGAAALGAALMLVRPWRWSLVKGQGRALRAEVLRTVRTELFHVPLQMLLASVASFLVVQAQSAGSTAGAGGTADGTADGADGTTGIDSATDTAGGPAGAGTVAAMGTTSATVPLGGTTGGVPRAAP